MALLVVAVWFWQCLPDRLFDEEYSTILEDSEGNLLGAVIASDGQWRFPKLDSIPDKCVKSILYFEDEYFYRHPGVNPVSLFRALSQNIKAGEIVSGGSTIDMQLIRLSRMGKPRNIYQKLVEIVWATRLELKYPKDEILKIYLSYAPFGGNVVGMETAAWRYYSKSIHDLSWAEAASLAVLPNAPSIIFPGRNQQVYRNKRDRLLKKLWQKGVIDSLTYETGLLEELPSSPKPLPNGSYHLLQSSLETEKGERIRTSLNGNYQRKANEIARSYYSKYRQNYVHNLAVLVADNRSNKILAYVGNTMDSLQTQGQHVDVVHAPRSSGSILKPFLYAGALDAGAILPDMLINDIPSRFGNFRPVNYDNSYSGMVPASEALARSLNVPSVHLLKDYGIPRFHDLLNKLSFTTITRPSSDYGLSLVLGGAETTLYDLVSAYSFMAKTLNHFVENDAEYFTGDMIKPDFRRNLSVFNEESKSNKSALSAGAAWLTLEALLRVNRPLMLTGWENFNSSEKIAWKTGTSYGNRDAWAVGVNPKFTVGVWVGNATGQGRPDLTGVGYAAPVMFEVFNFLPATDWFNVPHDDLIPVEVCSKSGHKAAENCSKTDTILIHESGLQTGLCPYHKMVHLSSDGSQRINSSCAGISDIRHEKWFALPPVQEWYYRQKHPEYIVLPPFKEGCLTNESNPMEFVYPFKNSAVYIPVDLDGNRGEVVLEIAHRNPATTLFWHLDYEYIGSTKHVHQMGAYASNGWHTVVVTDEDGNSLTRRINFLNP